MCEREKEGERGRERDENKKKSRGEKCREREGDWIGYDKKVSEFKTEPKNS